MPLTLSQVEVMYFNMVEDRKLVSSRKKGIEQTNLSALSMHKKAVYPKSDANFEARLRYSHLKAEIRNDDEQSGQLEELIGLKNTNLLDQVFTLDSGPAPSLRAAVRACEQNPSPASARDLTLSIAAARHANQNSAGAFGLYSLRKVQFLAWLVREAEVAPTQGATLPQIPPAAMRELRLMTTYANMDAASYSELIPDDMRHVIGNRAWAASNFLGGGKGFGAASAVTGSPAQLVEAYNRITNEKCGVCTNFALAAAHALIKNGTAGRIQVMASRGHVFVALGHEETILSDFSDAAIVDVWYGAMGNADFCFSEPLSVPPKLWQYCDGAKQVFVRP